MSQRPFAVLLTALLAGLVPAGPLAAQTAPRSEVRGAVQPPFQVTTFARGLRDPWGLAFLPDGRALVTEQGGQLRLVSREGTLSEPLAGVPTVYAQGQGGLLDVAVDPGFEQNRLVYLSFSEPGEGGAGTAVARGRLGERGLDDVQTIWRQTPKVSGPNHWGSRLVFRGDGTLFVTLGDRYNYRERAQDLSTTIGKVVRINTDGSAARDNPFVGREGVRPEIWSYGHRNVQSAVLDGSGNLWTVEHGARGGDELNNPQAGRNYGWPVISYGVDYSGAKLGEGTAKSGMEQPVYYWDPVIAPSGAAFYTGNAFDWRGDLLVGGLRTEALVRLEMEGARVTRETRYDMNARIRDVVQGPDGLVYLLTDAADGRILRLQPSATR